MSTRVVRVGAVLIAAGAVCWAASERSFGIGLWPALRRFYEGIGFEPDTARTLIPLTRKWLHVPAYAVVGALAAWATHGRYRLAFVVTMMAAGADEWIQVANPKRHGQVSDLGLDAIGAAIGIAFVCWILRRQRTSGGVSPDSAGSE